MSTTSKAPLRGHWPIAFALGGSVDDPAVVPLNYTANVLAGDEYCLPVAMPDDPVLAEYLESRLDERGWVRMGPALGTTAVSAVLATPDLSDCPLIVVDEKAKALSALSSAARACITLEDIRDTAREVMPDRDLTGRSLVIDGGALDQARDLGFAVYWVMGDGVTPTRRRKVMAAAGWPDPITQWMAQPAARDMPANRPTKS